jgi:hypothetical protein
MRADRSEHKKLERYVESLRRITVVSKSKVELLEDKLAHLGRQYYEAVSELAALKGEVGPAQKKDEASETSALDAQMDEAAREAGVRDSASS